MFELSSELYYCNAWKHQLEIVKESIFDICISDAISGNEMSTLLQYHILIQKDGEVARLCQIKENIKDLYDLELQIKNSAMQTFEFSDTLEQDNSKIWYYPKTNTEDNVCNPYLRIAVTIANLITPSSEVQIAFKQILNKLIWQWVKD